MVVIIVSYLIIPILNWKLNWLTFLSPFHHYHRLLNHITAFTTAIAFDDYTSIITARRRTIDLNLDLEFISEADLCPLFGGHLEFEQSSPFIQVIQYE